MSALCIHQYTEKHQAQPPRATAVAGGSESLRTGPRISMPPTPTKPS